MSQDHCGISMACSHSGIHAQYCLCRLVWKVSKDGQFTWKISLQVVLTQTEFWNTTLVPSFSGMPNLVVVDIISPLTVIVLSLVLLLFPRGVKHSASKYGKQNLSKSGNLTGGKYPCIKNKLLRFGELYSRKEIKCESVS